MSRPIIIDTDPGQDDAIGILLALASPEELDLLGIVAVAGNVPLGLTERNARALCELAGKPETKVFQGCSRPLVRPLVTAEHVHGKTGLDGSNLQEPTMQLQPQHGVFCIIESLLEADDDSVTLCLFAPQTNIGMAFSKAPEVLPKIKEVVFMGGGFFEGGNITPAAEFNIYVDPEAAKIVLESGVKITMLPLDVTHKTLVKRDFLERLSGSGKNSAIHAAKLLDFFERYDVEKYGSQGGPFHDPNVIVYLLHPEIYNGKLVNVEIEVNSELTRGMTVVDWWHVTNRKPNAYYVNEVQENKFFETVLNKVLKLEVDL